MQVATESLEQSESRQQTEEPTPEPSRLDGPFCEVKTADQLRFVAQYVAVDSSLFLCCRPATVVRTGDNSAYRSGKREFSRRGTMPVRWQASRIDQIASKSSRRPQSICRGFGAFANVERQSVTFPPLEESGGILTQRHTLLTALD